MPPEIVAVPGAPEPPPPTKVTPGADVEPMPTLVALATAVVPTNVKETPVPLAVALLESVIEFAELIAVITVLVGMPVPVTVMPTTRLPVEGRLVMRLLPLVVSPVRVMLPG